MKNKSFIIWAAIFGLIFAALLSFRLDVFSHFTNMPEIRIDSSEKTFIEQDTWMNIFQNGRKIGYSHTVFSKPDGGIRFQEKIFMRINTMGMVQDMYLDTDARLNPDYSLSDIFFKVASGAFQFEANGKLKGNTLSLKNNAAGEQRAFDIPLKEKIFLSPGPKEAIRAAIKGNSGDVVTFLMFDPATLGQEQAVIRVLGKETIVNMGNAIETSKVGIEFKGIRQTAWMDSNGEVIKESGFLGMLMEKTSKEEALFGIAKEGSDDMTKFASVPLDRPIDDLPNRKNITFEVSGIELGNIPVDDRQSLNGNLLTLKQESLSDLPQNPAEMKEFLAPTLFIQADNPQVLELASKILTPQPATQAEKTQKILEWVYSNIEKRPVLSLPDALSTLKNKVGDCNEHAALFAALARAAGIPCRIEAGLAYMKGSFYYHAWNSVYLGKWITVDSVFKQFPADLGHIRLADGEHTLDLVGVIGKISLKLVE